MASSMETKPDCFDLAVPWQSDQRGQVWQSLVLLAATGLAVSFVLGSRASIVYAATVTYALIGVGISTGAAGLGVLTLVCVIGVTLVWASVVVIRAADARHPSPTPRGSQRAR